MTNVKAEIFAFLRELQIADSNSLTPVARQAIVYT